MHPNVAFLANILCSKYNNVIDATSYPDCNELLCGVDVLISDYSSVLFDFLMFKHPKPAFRFILDEQEYEKDRSTYFPKDFYPWPTASGCNELNKTIESFDYDKYLSDAKRYLDGMGYIFNPNADSLCRDFIIDYIVLKSKKKLMDKYLSIIYGNN